MASQISLWIRFQIWISAAEIEDREDLHELLYNLPYNPSILIRNYSVARYPDCFRA